MRRGGSNSGVDLLLLSLMNLREGQVLWVDLVDSDPSLGYNLIVVVTISAVLAMSRHNNTINVRGSTEP